MKPVQIKDDYITLGQLLKLTEHISTGGEVKFFLQEHEIKVNGTPENRRGKKLYPGDDVKIDDEHHYKVVNSF